MLHVHSNISFTYTKHNLNGHDAYMMSVKCEEHLYICVTVYVCEFI